MTDHCSVIIHILIQIIVIIYRFSSVEKMYDFVRGIEAIDNSSDSLMTQLVMKSMFCVSTDFINFAEKIHN